MSPHITISSLMMIYGFMQVKLKIKIGVHFPFLGIRLIDWKFQQPSKCSLIKILRTKPSIEWIEDNNTRGINNEYSFDVLKCLTLIFNSKIVFCHPYKYAGVTNICCDVIGFISVVITMFINI